MILSCIATKFGKLSLFYQTVTQKGVSSIQTPDLKSGKKPLLHLVFSMHSSVFGYADINSFSVLIHYV